MERWLKSKVLSFDVRDAAVISEKTCKAANEILKVPVAVAFLFCTFIFESVTCNCSENDSNVVIPIIQSIIHAAEEALPRSAENMALAIGALCMVIFCSATFFFHNLILKQI